MNSWKNWEKLSEKQKFFASLGILFGAVAVVLVALAVLGAIFTPKPVTHTPPTQIHTSVVVPTGIVTLGSNFADGPSGTCSGTGPYIDIHQMSLVSIYSGQYTTYLDSTSLTNGNISEDGKCVFGFAFGNISGGYNTYSLSIGEHQGFSRTYMETGGSSINIYLP